MDVDATAHELGEQGKAAPLDGAVQERLIQLHRKQVSLRTQPQNKRPRRGCNHGAANGRVGAVCDEQLRDIVAVAEERNLQRRLLLLQRPSACSTKQQTSIREAAHAVAAVDGGAGGEQQPRGLDVVFLGGNVQRLLRTQQHNVHQCAMGQAGGDRAPCRQGRHNGPHPLHAQLGRGAGLEEELHNMRAVAGHGQAQRRVAALQAAA